MSSTKDMIENLTEEQENLMATIATEYEVMALSGDYSYDPEHIQRGVDFIYTLAELKPPQIIICSSPKDMIEAANEAQKDTVKNGETFDYIGCGYDSGWTAFYDFMQRIGIEFDKDWDFDTWRDFVLKSGVFACILCENTAFVCIRPCAVHRNELGDLHNPQGMAIEWADGYGEYSLNGVWVDEKLVLTPAEKLDPSIVLKEKNAEVRREIVRKIGIERVMQKLGAEVIDHEGDYELVLLDLHDGRKREYLKMKNPSINVIHVEGVKPGIKTVRQALIWRNGMDTPPTVLT